VSDLLAGQTIRAKITGAATGTNNLINATATAMILRFLALDGNRGHSFGHNFHCHRTAVLYHRFHRAAFSADVHERHTL